MRLSHPRDSKGRKRKTFQSSGAATTCPQKKKCKEDFDSKAAASKGDDGSDDDVAMSAHVPREKRWGDIVL